MYAKWKSAQSGENNGRTQRAWVVKSAPKVIEVRNGGLCGSSSNVRGSRLRKAHALIAALIHLRMGVVHGTHGG